MGKCIIQIWSGGRVQEPAVIEGIEWETARKGEPGKLTFTVVKTEGLSFSEGARVTFWYDDTPVFFGFVFEKRRNKDHHIKVTAYDQLRYLKNKISYVWTGVRADQVVSRIAEDFKLKAGELPNTGYIIPKFDKENVSLFDMILDAIDETAMATGNLYYLYSDYDKLMLKNIKDSTIDLLIDASTASDFDYTTSIDKNTYNRIVLVESEEQKIRNVAKLDDTKTIQQWGVLQNFVSVNSGSNIKAMAAAMLNLYNRVSRSLTIKRQKGDIRVRAGCGIYLDLNLGDMIVTKQRMLVEKAKHVFDNDDHYMDLTLQGKEEFYD